MLAVPAGRLRSIPESANRASLRATAMSREEAESRIPPEPAGGGAISLIHHHLWNPAARLEPGVTGS